MIPLNGAEHRRSIYVQARRSRPLAVLDTFDWPRMSPNCDIRRPTTGAPQSLMLMNSDFVLDYADSFAARVASEAGEDRRDQVTCAWRLAFCRTPDESEIASATAFLDDQTTLFLERSGGDNADDAPTPQQRALSSLCQMLFSSNEFLYVD